MLKNWGNSSLHLDEAFNCAALRVSSSSSNPRRINTPPELKVLKPVPMASTLRREGDPTCRQSVKKLFVCQGDEDRGRSCLSCPTYCSICTGRELWLDGLTCSDSCFPKHWIMKILQGMWQALWGLHLETRYHFESLVEAPTYVLSAMSSVTWTRTAAVVPTVRASAHTVVFCCDSSMLDGH